MQAWYLFYTKPHKEALVNQQLEDRGFETFFPHTQFARGYRRGIRLEPFFPHYLFVHVDLTFGTANDLKWLPGMRSIVHFGNSPAVVPEQLISSLRQRLEPYEKQVVTKTEWLFRSGQKVMVKEGPFEGFDAIFQKGLDGHQRVQVLLNVLGTWTRTQLDVEQIKPLGR